MANYQSNYQTSEYLNANSVFQIGQIAARITAEQFKVFNSGEGKVVLNIATAQGEKQLPLNKTNFDLICEFFGNDSDGWIGKAIILTTVKVSYNGKTVNSIRILNHPENDNSKEQTAPPAPQGSADVIPF